MTGLRALWRLLAALAVTAYDAVLVTAGSLLLAPWPARQAAWQVRRGRHWGRALTRLLGVRLEVRGRAPEPPFLLVANHLSYVDIWVLQAVAGGCFVAKADLRDWPLFGHVVKVSGAVLIDRGSKRDLLRVSEVIERRLAAGLGVVLFVEGTTGRGDALLPFKPSLLAAATRSGRPVHFATVTYRTPPGTPPPAESVCWWGDALFLPHFRRFLRLSEIEASVVFGDRPLTGGDRKQLATRLHQEMEALFEPCA